MKYRVIKNQQVWHNYFKLTIDLPGDCKLPIPGQFYNIRCGDGKEPLLRRPFSMHRLLKQEGEYLLEILYLVIGKGTAWLSAQQSGVWLDMIGPLGNGFIIETEKANIVLVARGIGIAPLYPVGEDFLKKKPDARIITIMGARLGERIFYQEECRALGEVYLYTDDGSQGFQGKAPELLNHLFETGKLPDDFTLYTCGPPEMVKELAVILEKRGLPGQAALETHMGCGFGACLSCAFPLKTDAIKKNRFWKKPFLQWSDDRKSVYALICKDGPIFDIQEVDWNEWLT